ncbi:hypothetical protein RB12407 [Rhodopirellula baltica SH 1]|uniref:Uncharacterized protein n=1 Tax=Rhodopirellula baltica (strain DSM 10527 / NCIMB 13988 / SH1) TaxID=243090 RepID=Q7UIP6_RHOBA|nr:hypothetical protein RB12407 [Rhodopirellula baltica SH 1]
MAEKAIWLNKRSSTRNAAAQPTGWPSHPSLHHNAGSNRGVPRFRHVFAKPARRAISFALASAGKRSNAK